MAARFFFSLALLVPVCGQSRNLYTLSGRAAAVEAKLRNGRSGTQRQRLTAAAVAIGGAGVRTALAGGAIAMKWRVSPGLATTFDAQTAASRLTGLSSTAQTIERVIWSN
jgi:hypothetical protein